MNKLLIFLLVLITFACGKTNKDLYNSNTDKGSLFIIGGGKRSPEMLKVLIDESKLSINGYIVVLPMSSEEPDSAFYFAKKQSWHVGIWESLPHHLLPSAFDVSNHLSPL